MREAEPYWHTTARAMRAEGASLRAIAAAVGRSATAVFHVFHPERKNRGRARSFATATPEARRRSMLRFEARREAAETGEPVDAIYARWGCRAIDRARVWEARRAGSAS